MRIDSRLAVASLVLTAVTTAAHAQAVTAWRTVPTAKEVAGAYPNRARSLDGGDALLGCKVSPAGAMTECNVVIDSPPGKGFGGAALRLSEKFSVDPSTPGPIAVPVHFTNPGLIPAKRVIAVSDWTATPDPAKTESLFPAAAHDAKVATGVGKIECRVETDGSMADCAVKSETPTAMGFGAAALAAASSLRAALWTHDGTPTAGAYVDLPLRFNAPGVQAVADSGARPLPAGPSAQPGDIVVSGRRIPNNQCGEKDMKCWGDVAQEIWTQYPKQMEDICGGWTWTAEKQYNNKQAFLSEGSSMSAADAATQSDEMPRAEHFLCTYPHAKVDRDKKPAAAQPSGR